MSSGQAPPQIVQMEEIYDKKENILPLKQGRRADILTASWSPKELEQQEARFRASINNPENLHSNDPLEAYHCYLKWLREVYPSGHKSVPKLLEKACRTFKRDERYRNDPRYLNMWLMVCLSVKWRSSYILPRLLAKQNHL